VIRKKYMEATIVEDWMRHMKIFKNFSNTWKDLINFFPFIGSCKTCKWWMDLDLDLGLIHG
jgi:hypothetical protein